MNISAITPAYNNQPIKPIEALKTGSTQAYVQKLPSSSEGGDFLSVLYNAMQSGSLKSNGAFESTMLSKEITDLTTKSEGLLASNQNTHTNFFSLLNNAYHSLSGARSETLAGLPSNFAGYLSQKIGSKQAENTLFNEGTTPRGDVKRAKRSYENASMPLSSSEVFEA